MIRHYITQEDFMMHRLGVRKKCDKSKYFGFLILLIAFAMVMILPREVKAEVLGFEIEDGVLVEYYGKESNVVIPDTVTSIANEVFFGNNTIKSVTIPKSVTSIGDMAFYECTSLSEVVLNNGIKSIGLAAFFSCIDLKSVVIPETVNSVGANAFQFCRSLNNITIPDSLTSLGKDAFRETPWLKEQRAENPMVIAGGVLIDAKECSGAVKIPATVKYIGDGAFNDNEKLTDITIPNSVIAIGEESFHSCSKLTSVIIPNSVKSIGKRAFSFSEKLKTITIPKSVNKIGGYAFSGTAWLENMKKNNSFVVVNDIVIDGESSKGNVVLPQNIREIADYAFQTNNNITSVTLPNTVKTIGESAFYSCGNLKKINIPNSVSNISDLAFGYSGLESIKIPKSVKRIGPWAFYHCDKLITVENNSSITAIETETFARCFNIKKMSIPKTVKIIGDSAFDGCKELTSITLPGSVKSIGNYVFNSCEKLKTIIFPKSITHIGNDVFKYTPWLSSQTEKLVIINGILVHGCRAKGALIIPDTVTAIAGNAFSNSYCGITSVTIPDSVKSIGAFAFKDCTELKKVILPDSISKIDDGAFQGCKKLTGITLPESVIKIGSRSFSRCESLESITIPTGVLRIQQEAFENCKKLKNVIIKSADTIVHKTAFEGCSALNPIDYVKIVDKDVKGYVGVTLVLKAKSTTKKKNVWSVSDSNIASIDASTGILTPKKAGTVTVTVMAGELQDSFELTIKPTEQLEIIGPAEIASGSLDNYTIANAYQYKYTVWSISDPKSAQIDTMSSVPEPNILGMKAGTFVLTVKTETGEGQMTITVKHAEIIGDTTLKLDGYNIYRLPESDCTYSWSVSDETIAFCSYDEYSNELYVKGLKEGIITITAVNEDAGDKSELQVTVIP
jgi:hypothetical protein